MFEEIIQIKTTNQKENVFLSFIATTVVTQPVKLHHLDSNCAKRKTLAHFA